MVLRNVEIEVWWEKVTNQLYTHNAAINFFEHVDKLKEDLNVDPEVIIGETAIKFLRDIRYEKSSGCFDYETNIVYVVETGDILALAHEMRHAWQYKNRLQYNFDYAQKGINKIAKLIRILKYPFSKKEWNANLYAVKYGLKAGLKKDTVLYISSMPFVGIVGSLVIGILIAGLISNLI